MQKSFQFMISSLVATGLLSGCTAMTQKSAEQKAPSSAEQEYTQIIAFGDSYSDDGASYEITKRMVDQGVKDSMIFPGDLYWQNRWTNGPTAVEVMADELDIPLIDYAVGGAKSGEDNYYHWMNPYEKTGVIGQVESFSATLNGQPADADALYFIFISANDFFEHTDYALEGTVTALADSAVANIDKAVTRLSTLGAKHFMIVNSSDLEILPAVTAAGQTELASEFQTRFNTRLQSLTETLVNNTHVDITLFDHIAASNMIMKNPEDYGFTNLTDACQPVYPEVKPVCASPDEYYFWDEWHPTRHVHAIMGEKMAEAVL